MLLTQGRSVPSSLRLGIGLCLCWRLSEGGYSVRHICRLAVMKLGLALAIELPLAITGRSGWLTVRQRVHMPFGRPGEVVRLAT